MEENNLAEEYIHLNANKRLVIYKIYVEYGDPVLHVEKYPVIYCNDNYVYFKKDKNASLDFISNNNSRQPCADYLRSKDVYDSIINKCMITLSNRINGITGPGRTFTKGYTMYPVDYNEIANINRNINSKIASIEIEKLKCELVDAKDSQLKIQNKINELQSKINKYQSEM